MKAAYPSGNAMLTPVGTVTRPNGGSSTSTAVTRSAPASPGCAYPGTGRCSSSMTSSTSTSSRTSTTVLVTTATSTVVEVRDDELRVGRAHIPVSDLGEGAALDASGVHVALGPGSDARVFVCVRAWIRSEVTLAVVDPRDPTPRWLVSTRRPDGLLEAVRAAQ